MYFNASYHSYTLPGTNNIGDIFKVTGSKAKITGNIPPKKALF